MARTDWMIRRISTTELEAFRRIRLEALRCEPDAFASSYAQWCNFLTADWNARMSDPIFVAFIGHEPIALMALKPLEPAKMAHRATLAMVYVNKSFRGSGLARAMLEAVTGYAVSKRITQIELGVRADREQAIRFYKGVGFHEIGRVPHGHTDARGEFDEILMALRLSVGKAGPPKR